MAFHIGGRILAPVLRRFRRLYIDGWLASDDFECVAGDADDGAERRSGEMLAVRAMADGSLFRVCLGL